MAFACDNPLKKKVVMVMHSGNGIIGERSNEEEIFSQEGKRPYKDDGKGVGSAQRTVRTCLASPE